MSSLASRRLSVEVTWHKFIVAGESCILKGGFSGNLKEHKYE